MVKAEPQFDVNRVSWMNMRYPGNRMLKSDIIKKEARLFEDKIRRDLCVIKELNAEKK